VDKVRMAVAIPTAIAIVAAILLCPFPMRVDAPLILQPKDATSMFVQTPGLLSELHIKDGQLVEPGQLLAILDNPDLKMKFKSRQQEYDQYQQMERSYRTMSRDAQAKQARLRSQAINRDIDLLRDELSKLELRVPVDVKGAAFSPPKRNEMGKVFKSGDLFCQVGDPANLEAYIVVPQSEIGLIQEQQQFLENPTDVLIWVKLYGHVGDILTTKMSRISKDEITELPPALSNKSGGEVQTTTDEETKREMPAFRSYAVLADIPNADGTLTPGVRGIARFNVGYKSLWWRINRYIQQTLNFRL
jgi:putative peptide zinc metalloprotease protein